LRGLHVVVKTIYRCNKSEDGSANLKTTRTGHTVTHILTAHVLPDNERTTSGDAPPRENELFVHVYICTP